MERPAPFVVASLALHGVALGFAVAAGHGPVAPPLVQAPVDAFAPLLLEGATLEATLTSAGVVLSATPFAGAEIEVGAGVGNDLASVGIRGKLNLIDIEVPSEASLTLGNNGRVNYEMDTRLDIEALDGSIALVVKLVGEEIATLTLCSWDSYYDRTWSLAHEEGSFSL